MRLPPELFELVIKPFRDDKTTLTACATVCSEWRARSQHYLFDSVNLTCTNSIYTPANFVLLLENSPHLGASVHSLVVSAGEDHRFPSSPPKHIALKTLSALGQRLPNLRSLWLRGIGWAPVYDPPAKEVVKEIMNGFRRGTLKASLTVTSLKISNPPTQNGTRFRSLFHIFPAVTEFTLENGSNVIDSLDATEEPFFPDITRFSKFALLSVRHSSPSMVMVFPKSAIETVTELQCPLDRAFHLIAAYAKQSLLIVSLDVRDGRSHDDFSHDDFLADSPLHTLRLWSSIPLPSFGLLVPKILLKIPPGLQKLTIVFPFGSITLLTDEHWDAINASLVHLTGLQVLEVLSMVPTNLPAQYRELLPAGDPDIQRFQERLDERIRKIAKFGLTY